MLWFASPSFFFSFSSSTSEDSNVETTNAYFENDKKNMQTPSPDVSEAGDVEMWIWFNFFFLARSWRLLLV